MCVIFQGDLYLKKQAGMSADRKSSAVVALFSWDFLLLKYLKYTDPQAAVLLVFYVVE